jgi:hypothetical protein
MDTRSKYKELKVIKEGDKEMMIEQDIKDKYNTKLLQLVEAMVPLYIDAKVAQEDYLDKNIAYRLLSSIPQSISAK